MVKFQTIAGVVKSTCQKCGCEKLPLNFLTAIILELYQFTQRVALQLPNCHKPEN